MTPEFFLYIRKNLKFEKAGLNFYKLVDDFEKAILIKAVIQADWNISTASKMLRIPRGSLASMLKKKGIERPKVFED